MNETKGRSVLSNLMLALFSITLSASCSTKFGFSNLPQNALSGSTDGSPSGPPSGSTQTIHHIQPALAVRGMGCLSCHANLQANVITDFGFGNSWFLDADSSHYPSPSNLFGNTYYNPSAWQTFQHINGQITVPTASVPATMTQSWLPGSSGSVDLAAFITNPQMPLVSSVTSWWSYFKMGTPPSELPLTYAASPIAGPSGNPLPTATEQAMVYIGAPTASEIRPSPPSLRWPRRLFKRLPEVPAQRDYLSYKAPTVPTLPIRRV